MQTDTPIQNKEIRQTYQLVICYREAFPEKTEGDYSFVYKTEISTFDLNGKNAKTDPLKNRRKMTLGKRFKQTIEKWRELTI